MLSYIRGIYEYYNSSSKKEKHQITINNNSYDISEYNHPGGSIILDAINNDATNIFYSTHPKYVWDLIEKPSFKKNIKYQVKKGVVNKFSMMIFILNVNNIFKIIKYNGNKNMVYIWIHLLYHYGRLLG